MEGDNSEFDTFDILRSIAICDHLNDSDDEKYNARLELLRRNPDLESQPRHRCSHDTLGQIVNRVRAKNSWCHLYRKVNKFHLLSIYD